LKYRSATLVHFLGRIRGDTNVYDYALSDPVNLVDESGLGWEYSQSTGQTTYVQTDGGTVDAGTGYSGYGDGLNNPAMQDVPNVGPIPQGTYTLDPMTNNTTAGGVSLPDSMRITQPDGGSTLPELPDGGTRSGYSIHGDNPKGDHSASQGCIILDKETRKKIANSGDTKLIVVP